MGELIMKTLRLFFAAPLAIVAASCAKESAPAQNGSEPETVPSAGTFFAEFGEKAGKVTMDNSYALSWEAGDQVSIYKVGASEASVYTAETAGTSTRLSGGEAVDENAEYYAVYPASAAVSFDAASKPVAEVPASQALTAGTLPVNVAVAYTTGAEAKFSFKNVGALLQFTLGTSDVARVCVAANDGGALAGEVEITLSAAPSYTEVSAYKTLNLTPASGNTFAAGTYYAAILPRTYVGGLNVRAFNAAGEQLSLSQSADQPILRSTRLPVGTIDSGSFSLDRNIRNAAEFVNFLSVAASDSETWTIANDIDLFGIDITPAASFAGTLEGGNHTLDNLSLTSPLFTTLSGTVQNLKIGSGSKLGPTLSDDPKELTDEVVLCSNYAFIAGKNTGSILSCENSGAVGIGSTIALSRDSVMAIGTLAGINAGTVKDCVNKGGFTISPSSVRKDVLCYFGGVVGKSETGLENCDNTGKVTFDGGTSTSINLGGICGYCSADDGTLEGCDNSGEIVFKDRGSSQKITLLLGGVVGYSEAVVSSCSNSAPINCDSHMSIAAVGGIVGNSLNTITACSNVKADIFYDFINKEANGVQSLQAWIGGISGNHSPETDLRIENCITVSGNITVENGYLYTSSSASHRLLVGGVAGQSTGAIVGEASSAAKRTTYSGTITINGTTETRLGGIVGECGKTISNATFSGKIIIPNLGTWSCVGGFSGVRSGANMGGCTLTGQINVNYDGEQNTSNNVRVGLCHGIVTAKMTTHSTTIGAAASLTSTGGTYCGLFSGAANSALTMGTASNAFTWRPNVTFNGTRISTVDDLTDAVLVGRLYSNGAITRTNLVVG